MSIAVSKWNKLSFYTGFNYMRLIKSGSYAVPGASSSTSITLPSGSGTNFVEVYIKIADGSIIPVTSQAMTLTRFSISGSILLIESFSNYAKYIYYFVYRSNA